MYTFGCSSHISKCVHDLPWELDFYGRLVRVVYNFLNDWFWRLRAAFQKVSPRRNLQNKFTNTRPHLCCALCGRPKPYVVYFDLPCRLRRSNSPFSWSLLELLSKFDFSCKIFILSQSLKLWCGWRTQSWKKWVKQSVTQMLKLVITLSYWKKKIKMNSFTTEWFTLSTWWFCRKLLIVIYFVKTLCKVTEVISTCIINGAMLPYFESFFERYEYLQLAIEGNHQNVSFAR